VSERGKQVLLTESSVMAHPPLIQRSAPPSPARRRNSTIRPWPIAN